MSIKNIYIAEIMEEIHSCHLEIKSLRIRRRQDLVNIRYWRKRLESAQEERRKLISKCEKQ